jgi:hypothetical protein
MFHDIHMCIALLFVVLPVQTLAFNITILSLGASSTLFSINGHQIPSYQKMGTLTDIFFVHVFIVVVVLLVFVHHDWLKDLWEVSVAC